MPRPRTITDEHILEAARSVFEEHGYSATTAQIAQRAGVSEGTLFKRFSSKEELFAQVIGLHERPDWLHDLKPVPGGDPRRQLEAVCLRLLAEAREVIPRIMLLWTRGHAPPFPRTSLRPPPPERALAALQSYLDREVEAGRLRANDTAVTARVLIGAMMHFVITDVTHPDSNEGLGDARFVHGLMEVLWPGLEA